LAVREQMGLDWKGLKQHHRSTLSSSEGPGSDHGIAGLVLQLQDKMRMPAQADSSLEVFQKCSNLREVSSLFNFRDQGGDEVLENDLMIFHIAMVFPELLEIGECPHHQGDD
jgi:hypothetical protein